MAKAPQKLSYQPSPSGYYNPKLAKRATVQDHDYLPGHDHTVNQEILDAMIAQGAVTSVVPAA